MAADPTKCKIKAMSPGVISEWAGSFGEFKGLLKMAKPPMGCSQSDWKDTLQKWLIAQFFVAILVFPLQLGCFVIAAVVAEYPTSAITTLITDSLSTVLSGFIGAFFVSWLGWFMLIKRQPNCFCFFFFIVEDWKFMHLLYGFGVALNGIGQLLNSVTQLLDALEFMSTLGILYVILYIVASVLVAIFAITQIYVGRAAIGMGQEIAGIKLPLPGEEKPEAAPEAAPAP